MSEIIIGIEKLSKKTGINLQDFPIYYFDSFLGTKIFYFVSDDIILPFIVRKNYFLKQCQCVFYPLRNNNRLDAHQEELFLNEFIEVIKEKSIADRIVQPLNHVIFRAFPKNAITCKFGSYYIDLSLSEEQIWSGIHSKHKNVIRNAEKNKVKILSGIDVIDDFYSLYVSTMKRSNMHFEPLSFFKNIFSLHSQFILCNVVYVDDIPVGGVFVPFTNYAAFYVYGASADKTIVNGAINYLHWDLIKLLKGKGIRFYDFVGARLSDVSNTRLYGIQKFKVRFGAQLENGYLWKYDISVMKCLFYELLFKVKLVIKNANYPFDIIDQERRKKIT